MSSAQATTNLVRSEQHIMTESKVLRLGYARVSTLNDQQTSSIESQQQRLEAYGCTEVYAERLSGGKRDRPQWQALRLRALKAVQQQTVEVVICNQGRFFRDVAELTNRVDELEAAGARVIDLDSGKELALYIPDERLRVQIRAVIDEHQRLDTAKKCRAAIARIRERRGRVGGKAPFGYQWRADNAVLLANSDQWAIARELVERFLAGEMINTLSKWLKEQGIKFTAAGITEWLKSEAIRGNLRYRYGAGLKESHVAFGTHEALITLAEDRAIRDRLALNRSHRGDRRVLAVSSLCRCIDCNRVLMQSSRHNTDSIYYYWRCRGKTSRHTRCPNSGVIPHRVIEPAILKVICSKAEEIAQGLVEPVEATSSLEILRLEAELSKLHDVYRQYPGDGLRRDIEQRKAQLAHLRSQAQDQQQHSAELREWVAALAEPSFWDGMGEEERNHLYRDLGIVVWCRGRSIVQIDCQI